jgi:hypothetical protein
MTEPNERKDGMKTIKRDGHRAAIALVVIGSALTIAAWGSSSKPRAPSRNHAILAFKRCMRAHGVPMHPGSRINPSSHSFKAAQAACKKLLPGFAHAKAQMLKVSKCMRQHGISGFPNPTLSVPPNSTPARAIARAGVILAIPSAINLRSPTFKQAAAVCGFPPDYWYPVQGGGPFAGTGHRYSS